MQGRVTWANKDLDDRVLVRSDGTPMYMLAVVVDDHDMGVTHIIRGDDHLTNSASQIHIYEALGWPVPTMAHIPMIHGPDGSKLSKRHGALGVEAYRAMGFLPEALRNYLLRLGWSQGDREFFSTPDMIEAFDLAGVGRSPSRFDFVKLENMNGHYLRHADNRVLVDTLVDTLPYLPEGPRAEAALDETMKDQLLAAMPGLKDRAKTLVELLDGAQFLFARRDRSRSIPRPKTSWAKGDGPCWPASCRRWKPSNTGGPRRSRRWCDPTPRQAASSSAKPPNPCGQPRPVARPRPGFSMCSRCWVVMKVSADCAIKAASWPFRDRQRPS